MKICILTIATNKYIQFVGELYNNIEENFLNDHDIECLLFTEHDVETSDNVRVSKRVYIPSNRLRGFEKDKIGNGE